MADFIHVPMAISALTQILNWGVENIQDSLSLLTKNIENKAGQFGFEATKEVSRVGHMPGVTFSVDQISKFSKKMVDNQVFVSFRGV
jgi:hypothetical protein